MFKFVLLSAALCLFAGSRSSALQIDCCSLRNNPKLYGIVFPETGRSFFGREADVLSISSQEYITTAFNVLEVNIVTGGPALLRIYHTRPLRPGEMEQALTGGMKSSGMPGSSIIRSPMPRSVTERMDERIEKIADTLTGTTVIKEYPLATHAHTIEFRVSSRKELLKLYQELEKHWRKEPAFFDSEGQFQGEQEAEGLEKKARGLAGTIFLVE